MKKRRAANGLQYMLLYATTCMVHHISVCTHVCMYLLYHHVLVEWRNGVYSFEYEGIFYQTTVEASISTYMYIIYIICMYVMYVCVHHVFMYIHTCHGYKPMV